MRAVLCLIVVGACVNPYTPDEYWEELANAHCQVMKDCCTSAEYADWWTDDSDGDFHSCFVAHNSPNFVYDIREGIKRGTIRFDESKGHSCVIALETMACAVFEPGIRFRETYCESPFEGVMPDGADGCRVDEECQSRHCDLADGTSVTGRCVPGIPPGYRCDGATVGICDEPYRCQSSGLCELGLPPGTSCPTDDSCADGWCDENGILTNGTCRKVCDGI